MSIQAIDAVSTTEASLYTTTANDSMGKMDFLQLLITQIQQQDPLNPQDPAEFTAQLTQFSNLEQMIEMNASIEDLKLLQISTNNTIASSLLGKDVMFEGNTLAISEGRPADLRFQAPVAAQEVVVTIRDASGRAVRQIQVGNATQGLNTIEWDGLDDYGNVLPDGEYTVGITGQDTSGNSIAIAPMVVGRATGMVFEGGATYLDIDGRIVSLSEIVSVYEPAESA